ncbi:MAG: hydrolase [Oscillospiraceae bacterium]|jgi:hypothetical protein|nr:hydrolase [Oscillospiraceae bacterium]
MFELSANNGRHIFEPLTRGEVLYESFHAGRCGKLSFGALEYDKDCRVNEGDSVSLRVNGAPVFFGVVFSKTTDGGGAVFTAYDQLRYFKNKDTYVYSEKRASDVVRMIAGDYLLRVGEISETEHVIASRVEDNSTLFDIVENALRLEREHKGKRYTLLDDFGGLSLKSEAEMRSNAVIDKDCAAWFRFFSSVDDCFNRVKLFRSDRKTGGREIFIAEDAESIRKTGVLQYCATLGDGENGAEKARRVLSLHSGAKRTLHAGNVPGEPSVRGGSTVRVRMAGFDADATVTRCVHKLSGGRHFMDLELGGLP